jgi:hypothetical protein
MTFRTCIAIGLTQADSTIASTAILAITDDLGGFEKSSWVFTVYLLTYSGKPCTDLPVQVLSYLI